MRRREEFPDNGFEAWGGYMNAKISKLEEQFTARAGNEENKLTDIFSGVSIFVNGYTVPSADELKTLMARHGGVYHTYQRSDDYVIASNLPDTKVKNMSLAKVVKPEWITDSIASNRLLDYRNYLLYNSSRTQLKLNFNKVIKDDSKGESYPNIINLKSEECSLHKEKSNLNKSALLQDGIKLTNINNNTNTYNSVSSNEILKQDNKNISNKGIQAVKTAADPNFISEFYNNSRLHHISQLGACFKQHINDLREASTFVFPARTQLKEKILMLNNNLSQINFDGGKTIMHIDMDCFFVSVGLRKRPELRGKPVAVTHSKGGLAQRTKRPGVDRNTEFYLYKQKQAKKLCKATGVSEDIEIESRVDNITDEDDKYGSMSEIASCSYEARAKGISNGMFMGAALRLCPDLQTIPYDFEGYKEVAYTLYNTVAQYTLDIEAVSCDEMYVDCSELLKEMDVTVQDFATALREEIKSKTGCPCSTGFGGNRLQARLATKRAKPDGQFFLSKDFVDDFIFDIKLQDLPGVGRQTAQKLEAIGHQTCGSLQCLSLTSLQHCLGNKTGAILYDQCRGRDPNSLIFHTVRKSVSAEVNYGIRFETFDQCAEFIKRLSVEVHSRMQQFKVLGKCITLKLMIRAEEAPVETAKFMGHGFCNVINKSVSLNKATNDADIITKEVLSLCKKQKINPKEMRGVGIQITKLESIINTKKGTGSSISKFLCKNTVIKSEIVSKTDQKSHICVEPTLNQNKVELDTNSNSLSTPKKTKRPQVDEHLSPGKKSPIIGQSKSPGKRRGRPKQKQPTSKNLMHRFIQGQVSTKEISKESLIKNLKQEEKKKVEQPQGLLSFPWQKIRELLRAWLESGQSPLPCDIKMIAEYMQEMVINRNIDKLEILLNFLRRRTQELNSSDWIEMYDFVLDQVQNTMIAIYGKKTIFK